MIVENTSETLDTCVKVTILECKASIRNLIPGLEIYPISHRKV